MRITDIKEGSRVKLRFIYKNEEIYIGMEVYGVNDENIYIPAVKDRGMPIQVKNLKEPSLIYHTEKGIYEFNDLEIKLCRLGGKFLYEVETDYEAERQNRREAFRLSVGEVVTVKILNKDGYNMVSGILKDISAVGMAVILPYELELGTLLNTVYKVDNKTKLNITGKVVRTEKTDNNRYLHGCKFNERSEVLGKILLKRQIEYKRRGLKT